MSVTDEIKSRIDIVSYVQQYVPLKKAGRYYKACCPFHSEKTPSFVVNQDTQSWRCFGACAEGGDLFSFAMKQHGWDFRETLESLGKQAGVEVRKQSPLDKQKAERADALRGLLKIAADTYHKHLLSDKSDDVRATLRYAMEKRGFTLETIKAFGIGYAPPGWQNMLNELTNLGYDEAQVIEAGIAVKNNNGRVYDRFRNRLMVPIRDDRGRVIGFGARVLDPDDNPKYLNSPQTPVFDKSKVLFGLDAAKRSIRDTETAVIVEGYMDVIQAHQAGFINVVAQMGTAMTETQLNLIAPRYAKRVVMALDADDAGQNATRRSLETARQTLAADYTGKLSVDIRVLQIPGAKDPDDLIREEPERWQALVDGATPVADYVINMEMAGLSEQASLPEREQVARRVLPILTASESDLYKQDNIQRLAMRLRIPERDLLRWASEQTEAEKQAAQRRKQTPPPPRPYAGDGMVTSSEEPPPLAIDELEEPPVDYDNDGYMPLPGEAPLAAPTPLRSDNKLERQCLRTLVTTPDTYYAVNRKLRELAGDNEQLRSGPLADLGVADFTVSDYRALMQMFSMSVRQHELDVIEFLRKNLDPALLGHLDDLLVDDGVQITQQMKARFGGELEDLIRQHNTRVKPTINPVDEMIDQALNLRRNRLNREIHELSFMQREPTSQAEDHVSIETQVIISKRARQILDAELQRQHNLLA